MKSNKNLLYPLWAGAILICIVLVAVSLIFVSCSGGAADDPADSTTSPAQVDDPGADTTSPSQQGGESPLPVDDGTQASNTRLPTTQDAGMEYVDRITFLGDSTTYGLKYYGVLSGGQDTTQVWTPSSGTLTLSNQSFATIVYPETNEELTIVEAVTKKKPEYLLVTLGVNGISFMGEDDFITEYTALVESILQASPETKVILNSIYPVAADYKYIDEISNEKISAANVWIEQIAQDTGVKFLYSYEAVAGSDGTLPDDYQNDDGIHLNTQGYTLVLGYIRTHAYI